MTVWRIPQCRGRLLGHTQGTPTVPRGPLSGPKLAPHNVFSGNVRGPKLTLPNGMCSTVLSYQRLLSPILSPPVLQLFVLACIKLFGLWDLQYNSPRYSSLVPTRSNTHQHFEDQLVSGKLLRLIGRPPLDAHIPAM